MIILIEQWVAFSEIINFQELNSEFKLLGRTLAMLHQIILSLVHYLFLKGTNFMREVYSAVYFKFIQVMVPKLFIILFEYFNFASYTTTIANSLKYNFDYIDHFKQQNL